MERRAAVHARCGLAFSPKVAFVTGRMPAQLTLYVNGDSTLSRRAIVNMRRIIADHFTGGHALEIVDVTREPERAETARILATPTLVRRTPASERRVTGDLSDGERVLLILELHDGASR
jgi:circadian clock protein KaiB